MSSRVTYLYKAELRESENGDLIKNVYFYSRRAEYVKEYCLEHYKPILHYNYIKVTRIGECKYTVKEPVIEFTAEETKQIEQYLLKETMMYAYFKQQLEQPSGV